MRKALAEAIVRNLELIAINIKAGSRYGLLEWGIGTRIMDEREKSMAEYVSKSTLYGLCGQRGITYLHVSDIDNMPAADVAAVIVLEEATGAPPTIFSRGIKKVWSL